jgi:hypothetical protein
MVVHAYNPSCTAARNRRMENSRPAQAKLRRPLSRRGGEEKGRGKEREKQKGAGE